MMKFVSATLAFSALLAPVRGAPAPVLGEESHPAVGWKPVPGRAVPYVPVTYPKQGEIWLGASQLNVNWDTASVPKDKSFSNTAIFMGQNGEVISPEPLAANFSLMGGNVNIQTPKEINGDDFQIILYADHGDFGDRGSYSEDFTIANVD